MQPESTTTRRSRLMGAGPWLWLGISAVWAAVVFAAELAAWPLAIWVAITLGPLMLLRNRPVPVNETQPGGTP